MERSVLFGLAALRRNSSLCSGYTCNHASSPSAGVSMTVAQSSGRGSGIRREAGREIRYSRERVTVGATLPADVELVEVPADWGPDMRRYRYIIQAIMWCWVELSKPPGNPGN